MTVTVLEFDFPYSGPWGAEMAKSLESLAKDIAGEPDLLWKVWTENQANGRAGGVYLFADESSAEHYRAKHSERLASFGVRDIAVRSFSVNAALSAITKAPL
jgi:hypothetical protein